MAPGVGFPGGYDVSNRMTTVTDGRFPDGALATLVVRGVPDTMNARGPDHAPGGPGHGPDPAGTSPSADRAREEGHPGVEAQVIPARGGTESNGYERRGV